MKLILAADENWAIGKGGQLLCHIPGDLKFFKEKTLGKTIIMGRGTLESLPGAKPLPGRDNIILSSREDYKVQGAKVVHSKEELLKAIEGLNEDDIIITGGEKVYRDYLPMCDTCYITKIHESFEADRFFVNLDEMEEFEIVWESPVTIENGHSYHFTEYRRKK